MTGAAPLGRARTDQGLPEGTLPDGVCVLGAGTMGSGIATLFAAHGVRTTVVARRESSLEAADRAISAALDRADGQVRHPVRFTTDVTQACREVELVVETVGEDLDAKRALLAQVDRSASAGTVVTTNTSSLPLGEVLRDLSHPERAAGLHWFNPADQVRLVEIVRDSRTSTTTAALLTGWMTAIGKHPVEVRRPVAGFVANRLQYALLREAYALVADGICSLSDVDACATEALGPRWAAVGPFQSMDLAGLDVHLAVAEQLFPDLATDRAVPTALADLVAAGSLGCKSGEGLLGTYDAAAVTALAERRALVATAVRAALADRPRDA